MVKSLFVRGNTKLGKQVLTFSIPAVYTCPGRSKLCESICYATDGFFHMPNVRKSLEEKYELSKSDNFAELVVNELSSYSDGLFRIHVAGDMYSKEYAEKWLYIVKHSPHIRFWVYTRSHRIPEIKKVIDKIAKLPNIRVFYSIDRETGLPKSYPKQVRLAYMSVSETDIPPHEADLVFRDDKARNTKQIRQNGVLVCVLENGKELKGLTCQTCSLCWTTNKDLRDMKREPEVMTTNRVSLPILS